MARGVRVRRTDVSTFSVVFDSCDIGRESGSVSCVGRGSVQETRDEGPRPWGGRFPLVIGLTMGVYVEDGEIGVPLFIPKNRRPKKRSCSKHSQ